MKIILSICNKYKYGHLSMSVIAIIIGLIYIVNEYYRLYTDLPFVGFVRCLPFFYLGFLSRQKNVISEKPQKKDLLFCVAGFLISLAIYSYERTTSGLYIYGICFWQSVSLLLSVLSVYVKWWIIFIWLLSITFLLEQLSLWHYIGFWLASQTIHYNYLGRTRNQIQRSCSHLPHFPIYCHFIPYHYIVKKQVSFYVRKTDNHCWCKTIYQVNALKACGIYSDCFTPSYT